jgi:hypothetical protein
MEAFILGSVMVKAYTVLTLLSVGNEVWNYNNPRPFPRGKYYVIQWEAKDFYSYKIKGEWVLRPKRKVDSKCKAKARRKWHEREANKFR